MTVTLNWGMDLRDWLPHQLLDCLCAQLSSPSLGRLLHFIDHRFCWHIIFALIQGIGFYLCIYFFSFDVSVSWTRSTFLGSGTCCVKAIKPANQDIWRGSILDGIIGYCIHLFHANIDHSFLSVLTSDSTFSFTVSVWFSSECECLFPLFSSQIDFSFLHVSRALLRTGLVTWFLHSPLMFKCW